MLDQNTFEFIREKYGYWASWAIWADEGATPKSNVGDLTVFETPEVLNALNPEVVLVGLNISRGSIRAPFANFHDLRSEATDYKIRYALKGSPFWGGYMTDIIKDFDQKSSGKVVSYLKANKQFERENVEIFRQELKDLGAINPTIIAFGGDAYSILTKNFGDRLTVLKVPHYANYTSKETYRDAVWEISYL
jgi:hypothetical protein